MKIHMLTLIFFSAGITETMERQKIMREFLKSLEFIAFGGILTELDIQNYSFNSLLVYRLIKLFLVDQFTETGVSNGERDLT